MKKNENGRSMIEMLGVLAIIGVLSAVGIYGYTVAMFRHQMNEVVHIASSLALMSRSANVGTGKTLTLASAGLPSKIGGLNLDMLACPESGENDLVEVHIQFIGATQKEVNEYSDFISNISASDSGISYSCGNGELSCGDE